MIRLSRCMRAIKYRNDLQYWVRTCCLQADPSQCEWTKCYYYMLCEERYGLSLSIYIYRYRRVPFSSSCFEQIVYGRSLLNDQIHMTFFPTSSIRMLVAISIGHQHFLEKDPLSSPRHDGRLTIGHATYEPPLGTVHATYVYVPSYLACKWPHQPIKVCRVTCQPTVSWLRFLFWLIFKQ